MPKVFVDLELDDEQMSDMAAPCDTVSNKKLLPRYPWGLSISFDQETLKKLKIDPASVSVGGMMHLHCMARITSVSCSEMRDGSESNRVELQIEQIATESEDDENEEADKASPARRRLRTVYDKK